MNRQIQKILSHDSSQDGFTLVELMVSLSLFIIIVLALIGSLYTVNDASRKVQAMRTVMDNLNFSMESMSRTIRTGESIKCGSEIDGTAQTKGGCPIGTDGTTELSVHSTLGEHQVVEYRWILNSIGTHEIDKRTTPIITTAGVDTIDYNNIGSWVAITSPEIDVQDFAFYVRGNNTYDLQQPNVIIKMQGVATVVGATTIPFAVQTFLSQRTPE